MRGSTVAVFAVGLSIACFLFSPAMTAASRVRTLDRLTGVVGASDDGRSRRRVKATLGMSSTIVRVTWAAGASVAGFWLAGPVGAFGGVVGAEVLRRGALARRRRRGRAQMDDQVGEALSTLSAAVRAGLSVRRALDEAHRAADSPLRDVLARAVDRLRMGQPLEAALEELNRGVGSSDAALVAALLDVHRRTGGDLPALLDEVGGIVEHRIEARRQIRSLTSQGRASGAVLAVLPIAFVGLLSGTGGDGLGAFYRTMPGAALLMAGLVCELLGFAWIRHIIRSDGEA